MPRLDRPFFRLLVPLTFLAAAGCMRGNETAVYHNGLSFIGRPGEKEFDIASWSLNRALGNNPPPAIVLHLPGGDLDNARLSDPKALQDRGWTFEDRGNGITMLTQSRDGLSLYSEFDNGKWVGVQVNKSSDREKAKDILTIDGKTFSLPISEEEMVRLFGRPAERWPKR
jgi:hypothetical protein